MPQTGRGLRRASAVRTKCRIEASQAALRASNLPAWALCWVKRCRVRSLQGRSQPAQYLCGALLGSLRLEPECGWRLFVVFKCHQIECRLVRRQRTQQLVVNGMT